MRHAETYEVNVPPVLGQVGTKTLISPERYEWRRVICQPGTGVGGAGLTSSHSSYSNGGGSGHYSSGTTYSQSGSTYSGASTHGSGYSSGTTYTQGSSSNGSYSYGSSVSQPHVSQGSYEAGSETVTGHYGTEGYPAYKRRGSSRIRRR